MKCFVVVSRKGGVPVGARAFDTRDSARAFLQGKIDKGAEAHEGPTGLDSCTVTVQLQGNGVSRLTYRMVTAF